MLTNVKRLTIMVDRLLSYSHHCSLTSPDSRRSLLQRKTLPHQTSSTERQPFLPLCPKTKGLEVPLAVTKDGQASE